jgi:hypothetical protein
LVKKPIDGLSEPVPCDQDRIETMEEIEDARQAQPVEDLLATFLVLHDAGIPQD